jgi:phosphate uptake regulator
VVMRRHRAMTELETQLFAKIQEFVAKAAPQSTAEERRVVTGKIFREMRTICVPRKRRNDRT